MWFNRRVRKLFAAKFAMNLAMIRRGDFRTDALRLCAGAPAVMRLREKGGKAHAMPCHRTLEAYLPRLP